MIPMTRCAIIEQDANSQTSTGNNNMAWTRRESVMAGERKCKAVSWQGHPGRYVIIDTETGEILDDAQGWGYRTPQKAYAAWGWKNRSDEAKAKERRIKDWMRKNKDFVRHMDDEAFYAWKDSGGHKGLRAKDVREMLKSEGIDERELGFTAGDLLRAYLR